MQDREPRDKKGNIIGVGDILVARRDDGEERRYKVIDIDTLQGSGAVRMESLENPNVQHSESRYWLWQLYEIEVFANPARCIH